MASKKYAAMRCRGSGSGCNSEGYRDPTSFLALRNVELEERYRARFLKRALGQVQTEKAKTRQLRAEQTEEERLQRENEYFAYEELANAVILQAVADWRNAKRRLRRKPHDIAALERVRETEAFFQSRWFCRLTRVSGKELLSRLKEECK